MNRVNFRSHRCEIYRWRTPFAALIVYKRRTPSNQSVWAGPNRLLVWFAQATLVSLLFVPTINRSIVLICLFFPLYVSNTFRSVYLRVDIFVLSIPGVWFAESSGKTPRALTLRSTSAGSLYSHRQNKPSKVHPPISAPLVSQGTYHIGLLDLFKLLCYYCSGIFVFSCSSPMQGTISHSIELS